MTCNTYVWCAKACMMAKLCTKNTACRICKPTCPGLLYRIKHCIWETQNSYSHDNILHILLAYIVYQQAMHLPWNAYYHEHVLNMAEHGHGRSIMHSAASCHLNRCSSSSSSPPALQSRQQSSQQLRRRRPGAQIRAGWQHPD